MTTQGWGGSDPWQQAMQDVQSSYRSHRVTYEPPDERADDTVTAKQTRPHATRALIVFLVAFGAALIIGCCGCFALGLGGSAAANNDPLGGVDSIANAIQGAFSFLFFMFVLAFAAWLVVLFFPLKEPIAEYSMLIEGRAGVAAAAYGYILQSAHQRATPFPIVPVRLGGQFMLSLGDKGLQSLISVQVYGSDLFFNWTMWRSRSTIVLIGHALRDGFRLVGQGGTAYRSAVAGGRIRALREITHSITRLGVQAAILNLMATPETQQMVEQVPRQELPPGSAPPAIPPMPPPSPQQTGAWQHQPQQPAPQYPATGPQYPTSGAPQYPTSAPPASGPPQQYGPYPPAGQ